jgi:hypothetical protein
MKRLGSKLMTLTLEDDDDVKINYALYISLSLAHPLTFNVKIVTAFERRLKNERTKKNFHSASFYFFLCARNQNSKLFQTAAGAAFIV